MKLLYVTSIDGDYGALSFQKSELGKKSYKEVYGCYCGATKNTD